MRCGRERATGKPSSSIVVVEGVDRIQPDNGLERVSVDRPLLVGHHLRETDFGVSHVGVDLPDIVDLPPEVELHIFHGSGAIG